ncbi:MAG: hypothetical protein ACFCUV_24015 [Rivularia sp. (in: cyanobacteria)]
MLLISHLLRKTCGIGFAIAKRLILSVASVFTVVSAAYFGTVYIETNQNRQTSNNSQKLPKYELLKEGS